MSKRQVLIESISPSTANLIESVEEGTKNLYLSGIMMQADILNGNGRKYPLSELARVVELAHKRLMEGDLICGELNHPDTLTIDLKNVSHAITELRIDGSNALGKCKILPTPVGQIAKGLLEGGIRLGVSSRGTGNVDDTGMVSGFELVTIDIVATPSAPAAYPQMVREALGDKKIRTLAEAVIEDPAAQKYFKKAMGEFITTLFAKK